MGYEEVKAIANLFLALRAEDKFCAGGRMGGGGGGGLVEESGGGGGKRGGGRRNKGEGEGFEHRLSTMDLLSTWSRHFQVVDFLSGPRFNSKELEERPKMAYASYAG